MDYTKENAVQMGGAHKTVKFDQDLSKRQKSALVQKLGTIAGLDTIDGAPAPLSLEGDTVLYWGDTGVEPQIREIVGNNVEPIWMPIGSGEDLILGGGLFKVSVFTTGRYNVGINSEIYIENIDTIEEAKSKAIEVVNKMLDQIVSEIRAL